MNTFANARSLRLALAVLALAAGAACGGDEAELEAAITRPDGSKPTALDREAASWVSSKIAEHWLEGESGWTTELQQRNMLGQVMPGVPAVRFQQVRALSFTLEPEPLSEAQTLNGADYRGAVTFAKSAERSYRTVETFEGPPGWSAWSDGFPRTLAIERRNGEWLMQDSEWFEGFRPSAGEVPSD